MALRYFNTFIDEEPEQVEASTGRLHRSKSWPQRCRSYTNVQTTDGVNYVTKLESKWSVTYGERLQMAPASATDETDVTPMTSQSGPVEAAGEASETDVTPMTSQSGPVEAAGEASETDVTPMTSQSGPVEAAGEASETDVTPMTSQSGPVEAAVEASENNESAPVAPALAVPPPGSGSHGHPALCRRPCIRLAKGSCEMGDACGYCHYEHDRNVSPDKRQRLLLNRMETSELLAVLLPHVRRSLEVAQIEAPDIILLLEAKVGSTTAPNVDHFLRRTLRRMPLSALLGLIMVRDGLRPFLEEQCEVLRCRLG